MTRIYETKSPDETERIGEDLARALVSSGKKRAFVALYGEMGVGKTAFARGFGRALGIENIKSPTYTVVNEHPGCPVPLFHFDLYRITDADDLTGVGYDDYLTRDGYILTEWSEMLADDLPEDAVTVRITRGEKENDRKVEIGGGV